MKRIHGSPAEQMALLESSPLRRSLALIGFSDCPPRRRRPVRPLVACLAAALGIADASPADHADRPATTIVVTNCDDSGPGSLREAFASAGDNDLIDLTGLTCGTITLTTGELVNDIPRVLTVRGPHDENYNPMLTISGSRASRIFHMTAGGLNLENLIVTAGRASGVGGCVATEYGVQLDHSTVSDCVVTASSADIGGGCIATHVWADVKFSALSDCAVSTTGTAKAFGGAIFSDGRYGVRVHSSTITGSTAHAASADSGGGAIWSAGPVSLFTATISGNMASGDGSHYARGGGIYAGGDFTGEYSTIAGNRADTGGGLFASGDGSVILIGNSTISGNEAGVWAGGLIVASAAQSLDIRSSTIADNRVPAGSFGGAYLAGVAAVNSTIIAGNTVSDGLQESDLAGAAGTTVTGGNNLIRVSSVPVPADTLTFDPMLGPLRDNGGYTWTHALPFGSPAIDRGSNVGGYLRDQRLNGEHGHAFSRVVGGSADIGAFEYDDEIFADSFDPS
jgi:hypothetical protein